MATRNNDQLNYLDECFADKRQNELEMVRVTSKWLERFPVQLPFELQAHQFVEPTAEELLVNRTSSKLVSLVRFMVGRLRHRQKLFDVLGRVHDFLLQHSSQSEEHQGRYKQLLSRLVKIKSMKKELSIEEFRELVVRELTDLLLANIAHKSTANQLRQEA